jgi:hypothetical protein
MCERLGVCKVVDGNKIYLRVSNRRAKDIATNATKSVNADLHRHVVVSSCQLSELSNARMPADCR